MRKPRTKIGTVATQRLREVITEIHSQGDYPSVHLIARTLGRVNSILNGLELKARREIFKELGITKKKFGVIPKEELSSNKDVNPDHVQT